MRKGRTLLIALLTWCTVGVSVADSDQEREFEAGLAEAAAVFNLQEPVILSDWLTRERTTATGKTILYEMRLTQVDYNGLAAPDTVRADLHQKILTMSCTDPQMMGGMRQGGNYRYLFRTRDSVPLLDMTANKVACMQIGIR